MTVVSKPLGKKRALLVAIQHVHRRAESDLGHLSNLDFTHRDAKELRDSLIGMYQANDIILMLDDRTHPKELWPTHGKILRQIDRLIVDAPEDCHFFFYFAGHGVEVEAESDGRANPRVEADGQDDEIVCSDGRPILNRILHDHLVTPLEKVKGATLFALFDCCHSESLLDLQRGREPNHYSRVWQIGRDQVFDSQSRRSVTRQTLDPATLALVICNLTRMRRKAREKSIGVTLTQRRTNPDSHSQEAYYGEDVKELNVICLSACRDGETAHDDRERGLTFTKVERFGHYPIPKLITAHFKCLLRKLGERPDITWGELCETLKELIEEIRVNYEAYLHDSSSDSDRTIEPWAQSPTCTIDPHVDLRGPVSF